MKERTIFVTEEDMQRLSDLVESAERISSRDLQHLRLLKEELAQAEIVTSDEIPADVVTMNSRVRLKDLDSGRESIYALVFPRDADVAQGRISVLAPIGTAIIGYRAGDVIVWSVPAGERRFRLEEILYQPEAAGHAA
ncbi:MAG TPA: nucleoside diphosphate kinase regulator [Terriglobales bacterium]|nr:nucleoside diphosphate kinase regulator [Terriglobales bacterium]